MPPLPTIRSVKTIKPGHAHLEGFMARDNVLLYVF
jgi:hypothetical protein